jgi:hypothetical protein
MEDPTMAKPSVTDELWQIVCNSLPARSSASSHRRVCRNGRLARARRLTGARRLIVARGLPGSRLLGLNATCQADNT